MTVAADTCCISPICDGHHFQQTAEQKVEAGSLNAKDIRIQKQGSHADLAGHEWLATVRALRRRQLDQYLALQTCGTQAHKQSDSTLAVQHVLRSAQSQHEY